MATDRRSTPLKMVAVVPVRFSQDEAEVIQKAVDKLGTNRCAFIRALSVREALKVVAEHLRDPGGLRDSTPEAEARAERDLEQLAREIAMDDGADGDKPWSGEDGG